MANWCMNILEISSGDPAKLEALAERLQALEKDAYGEVDGFLTALDPEWGHREAAGATFDIEEGVIRADFETAWSPPIDVYDTLVDEGYYVSASYYEPGMQIAGMYTDGYDEHVDYGNADKDFWETELGKQLDETWSIKESLDDNWEDD
jgi:hypothetical protein